MELLMAAVAAAAVAVTDALGVAGAALDCDSAVGTGAGADTVWGAWFGGILFSVMMPRNGKSCRAGGDQARLYKDRQRMGIRYIIHRYRTRHQMDDSWEERDGEKRGEENKPSLCPGRKNQERDKTSQALVDPPDPSGPATLRPVTGWALPRKGPPGPPGPRGAVHSWYAFVVYRLSFCSRDDYAEGIVQATWGY